jgi:hypothetical protein
MAGFVQCLKHFRWDDFLFYFYRKFLTLRDEITIYVISPRVKRERLMRFSSFVPNLNDSPPKICILCL